MGERFYISQLKATGTCPGINPNKRRKSMPWTDEEKAEVIEKYTSQDPTADNSIELVEEIAEEMEKTVNGVRMILSKAGVYIKKTPAKTEKSKSGTRISKDDAQAALTNAISDAGQEPNEDVISKMTGKAALYFTKVINTINE